MLLYCQNSHHFIPSRFMFSLTCIDHHNDNEGYYRCPKWKNLEIAYYNFLDNNFLLFIICTFFKTFNTR